jgi:hypothetical protein
MTVLSPNANFEYASQYMGGDLYNARHRNFAPTVGMAFDPTGSGRTVVRAGYSLSYVNDDLVGAIDSMLSSNLGLSITERRPQKTATLGQTLSAPTTIPPFNLSNLDEQGQIGTIDPNLRVPYVQQWNIGVQHIVSGFLLDARYVGNHATGMIREVNYNQVALAGSPFLCSFLAAKSGNPNPSCPTPANPILAFNTQYAASPNSNGFMQDVTTGQAATAALEYSQIEPGAYNLYQNGNALNGAGILGNYSSSTYNGLQLSARRLLRNGLQVQASYTFSKDLSDSARTTDSAFEPYRDALAPQLDRARTPFDLTHAFKGNFIYLLPSGAALGNGALRAVFGGWSLSGILTVQSGNPFSILSGYATVDTVTAALNTADATVSGSQLNQLFGVTQYQGRPYFIQPGDVSSKSPDFTNPTAGRLGFLQQREFTGPWVSDLDLGLQKTIVIRESQRIEIRGEALNVLNHASWLIGNQYINAISPLSVVQNFGPAYSGAPNLSFGQISNTFYPSRKIQVSVYYRF